jgi:hypothetical protein
VTSGLRRFRFRPAPEPVVQQGERCEMCAVPIGELHSHVVNVENRGILCTCRGCYLLFTAKGAGKHRAVPDRYLYAPSLAGGRQLWDAVGIPVKMAFFFANSELEKTVGFYPSPAGATESMLPLDAWTDLLAANPWFVDVQHDVEAVLVNQRDNEFEGFVVPIDACYELVGLVKMNWRGFDGGTEAWEQIDGYFAGLRERSKPVGTGDG